MKWPVVLSMSLALAVAIAVPEDLAAQGSGGPAKPEDGKKLFQALLEKASRENYVKVHKWLVAHEQYSPYTNDLNTIADLYEAGRLDEAQKKLDASMPNLMLSPRARRYASRIAFKLDRRDVAKREALASARCIEGILSTGDGSEKKPYLISRTSDEYDVLNHLNKTFRRQSLVRRDGKTFDVQTCADGARLWFDVTQVFGALIKGLEKPKR